MRRVLLLSALALFLSGFLGACKTDTSLRDDFEKEKEAKHKAETERIAAEKAAEEAEENARPTIDVAAVREDPEQIKDIIGGMFTPSLDGKRTMMDSINWVVEIGEPAVPLLVEILLARPMDGTAQFMVDYGLKNGVPEWRWRTGMAAAMALSQIRDPEAAVPLLDDLASPIAQPEGLNERDIELWSVDHFNRLRFDAWGLMSLFRPELQTKSLAILRDRKIEAEARLQLAVSLAYVFQPASMKTLLAVVKDHAMESDDDDEGEEEEAESPEVGEPLRDAANVIRFLPLIAQGLDFDHLPIFTRIFFDEFDDNFSESSGVEAVLEKRQDLDVQIPITVLKACRKNLECYLAVLEGNAAQDDGSDTKWDPADVQTGDPESDTYLRALGQTKAALVVGRWETTAQGAEDLVKKMDAIYTRYPYSPVYDDLRLALVLGLERQGLRTPQAAAGILKERMKMELMKGEDAVEYWNQRLQSLVLFLENAAKTSLPVK